MIDEHRTRNEEPIMIAQMEDEHLEKTITTICSAIGDLKKCLGGRVTGNLFKAAAYGVDLKGAQDKAKVAIPQWIRKLYPYVCEAMLRGMDVRSQLTDLMERDSKEEPFSRTGPVLLTAFSHNEYDEDGNPVIDDDLPF